MKDLNIILISKEVDYFKEFVAALADDASMKIRCITSGAEALDEAGKNKTDVVVAAEEVQEGSGLDLIRQVVMKNPFINTALVSPLAPDEFHEVTEGLGIFLQLSSWPGKSDADKFLKYLAKIY